MLNCDQNPDQKPHFASSNRNVLCLLRMSVYYRNEVHFCVRFAWGGAVSGLFPLVSDSQAFTIDKIHTRTQKTAISFKFILFYTYVENMDRIAHFRNLRKTKQFETAH